jgi:hypothetical protein
MLTFPSKLLLANSPKDTVDFGRRHEEIREHELKLYQVPRYRLIMHCVLEYHVHSSTTTKFSRSTHGSTTYYPVSGIRYPDSIDSTFEPRRFVISASRGRSSARECCTQCTAAWCGVWSSGNGLKLKFGFNFKCQKVPKRKNENCTGLAQIARLGPTL